MFRKLRETISSDMSRYTTGNYVPDRLENVDRGGCIFIYLILVDWFLLNVNYLIS